MHDVRYLESGDLAELLDVDDYIGAVREGYKEQGAGGQTAARTKLFHPHREGMLMYYGAILPRTGVMGTFSYLGEFEDGDAWFLTYLADTDTGEPLAIVDSPSVNPYKTGATGAVGVDALARPDATVLGVIGTGAQAKGQVLATAHVRDLSEVRVFSPTSAHREAFAESIGGRLDADVRTVSASNDAVRGADIIVTATTASDPVFDADALTPGAHITAMGQSHPKRRELDAETVARSVYLPDHRDRAEVASGELLGAIADGAIDMGHVRGELGDVLAGTVRGRTSDKQITVFDSGGTGIETVAATYRAYVAAIEAGQGVKLSMTPGREAFSDL